MTADELAKAVGHEAAVELADALAKIEHCLGQLSNDQIWWRPEPSLNSIGNLILHLCGNLRQWIVAGIGGAEDARNRSAEFAERGPIAKDALIQQIEAAVADAQTALRRPSAQQLLETRRIQGFDVSGLAAIFNSVPHFRGHTQEIVYLTRIQMADRYQFQWKPSTPEQGAPAD